MMYVWSIGQHSDRHAFTLRDWISLMYKGSKNSDTPSSRIPSLVTRRFPMPSLNRDTEKERRPMFTELQVNQDHLDYVSIYTYILCMFSEGEYIIEIT